MAAYVSILVLGLLFMSLVTSSLVTLVKHPSYIQVNESVKEVSSYSLVESILAIFGHPEAGDSEQVLQLKSIFTRPRANILFLVHSPDGSQLDIDGVQLSMSGAASELEVLNDVLSELFSSGLNRPLVAKVEGFSSHDVSTDPPGVVSGLLDVNCKDTNGMDCLRGELSRLKDVIQQISAHSDLVSDFLPDSMIFHIQSLIGVSKADLKESVSLVSLAVKEAIDTLSNLYGNDILIECVTVDSPTSLLRVRRQTILGNVSEPVNAASHYDELFPVAFNLVLWLTIIGVLVVIYVSSSLWYLDPGRDSIIYRMTTQRMKTD